MLRCSYEPDASLRRYSGYQAAGQTTPRGERVYCRLLDDLFLTFGAV